MENPSEAVSRIFRRSILLPGLLAGQQDAPGLVRAAADAAAQLVQLGQTEAFGIFDQQHGGVGHVDADFDHRGADQHAGLSGAEAGHDQVLFLRLEPSVQQGAGVRREPFAPPRVFRGGGFQPGAHALFDQGVDQVGLASFVEFLPEEGGGPAEFFRRADQRADGKASGRHFVEEGQIKVPVEGEGEGAGDGGGGHDEDVRVRFLSGKFGPLAHPEFVLLVDHDEGGAADGFRGEEQGVRADDDTGTGCAGFS
jgi:hypothetical protein